MSIEAPSIHKLIHATTLAERQRADGSTAAVSPSLRNRTSLLRKAAALLAGISSRGSRVPNFRGTELTGSRSEPLDFQTAMAGDVPVAIAPGSPR